jgi:penicillin amidase/acyl-homoserine-lactone acylase
LIAASNAKRLCLAALALVVAAGCAKRPPAPVATEAPPYDVRILRDDFGVPHVFGKTDADAAFGLAYAHSEDDFPTIQEVIFGVRGKLASVQGPSAAANDYVVALLGIWKDIETGWDAQLDARTRAMLEGYAAGVNYYAQLHSDEVESALLPVRGQDVLAGFALRAPFFFGLGDVLRDLYRGDGAASAVGGVASIPFAPPGIGSNTFAVAPKRSADRRAHLVVNSHQPWNGPVAWYEAHVHSDEGWNAVGGVFPGSPVILHGHNQQLGWAFTVNRPDLVDVYKLTTNDENQYWYDGAWRDFEVESVTIDVRALGFVPLRATRPVLRSVYGPVLRLTYGTYAIRWAGMGDVRQVEQWYRLNRASNWDEWLGAMKMQAIASFSAGYADRSGRIAYLYNARIPDRPSGYDWSGVVPGDTSATLWDSYLPFDALPRVVNPPSGFIQNCNSSPFETTIGPGNPDPGALPASAGIETRMTNRSLRALELLGADESITDEELHAIKFDVTYSEQSRLFSFLQQAIASVEADRGADAFERSAAEMLRAWNRRADESDRATSLAILTLMPVGQAREAGLPEPDPHASLKAAVKLLVTKHGRLDPPWIWMNRMKRGDLDVATDGGPDVLHAVEGPLENARVEANSGDGLMFFVDFGKDGVRSRSLHQYGSATSRPKSPHYADQVPLFVAHQTKPVWTTEAEIRAHLEREYRPGEELGAEAR